MARSDLGSGVDYETHPKGWGHLLVAMLFVAVFSLIVYESLSFPRLARFLPMAMGVLGLLTSAMQVVLELRDLQRSRQGVRESKGAEPRSTSSNGILGPIAWIASFFAAVAVLGFLAGSSVYVFVALLSSAKLHWLKALVGAASIVAFVYVLARFLGLELPPSLLGLFRGGGAM